MAAIKMGRWGWAIAIGFAAFLVVGLLWGFSTDWNWTSGRVLEASKNPKDGNPCTTADNKSGTYKNGACIA